MKSAVFYGKGDIRLEDRPVPKIEEHDLLVEVKACGICGTDVSRFLGKITYGHELAGRISGHEITGVIKKVGKRVRDRSSGERVVIAPLSCCGECYFCRKGEENLCLNAPCIGEEVDGGYTRYVRVPQKQAFRLPDNIGFEEGTLLADAVATPLHAVRKRVVIKPGDSVAVWGTGAQGYAAIQLAKLSGGRVIAVGRREDKLDLARELGADITINSGKEEVVTGIKDNTGLGADVCMECGGYSDGLAQAIASVRKGGTVVMIGLQNPQQCDLEDMLWNEKSFVASFDYTYQECRMGIRLAEIGKLELKRLVTHVFDLEGIHRAFDILTARKELVIKVVIRP